MADVEVLPRKRGDAAESAQPPVRPRPGRRNALLAGAAVTGAFIAVIAGNSGTALAQSCSVSGTGTVTVTCDAPGGTITTTNTSNLISPNPATNARNQTLSGNVVGNVTAGTTIDGFGLALTTGSGTATMTNDGIVTTSAAGGSALAVTSAFSNFDVVYSGNGSAIGNATSIGLVLVAQGGTGGVFMGSSAAPIVPTYDGEWGLAVATDAGDSNVYLRGGAIIGRGGNEGGIAISANTSGNVFLILTGNTAITNAHGSAGNTSGIQASSATGGVTIMSDANIGTASAATSFFTGISASAGGAGNITVNQTGGTIYATDAGIGASHSGSGSINITTAAGSAITMTGAGTGNGINAIANGSATRNVNITVGGAITGTGFAGIDAEIQNAASAGNITIHALAGSTTAGPAEGIIAVTSGTGSIAVTVDAGATVKTTGHAGILLGGVAANTILNSGTIFGATVGVATTSGSTTIINSGSIAGAFGLGVQFGGSSNLFVMDGANASLTGNAIGAGSDTFRFAGSSSNSFDVSQIGTGWSLIEKNGSSTWTLTGTSTFGGDINVNAGTLVVNGNMSSAGLMFVNPGATLSGTGTVPFTLLDDGATLAPGPLSGTGTLTINDRVMFCNCSIYAVKVSATGNDMARVVAGGFGTGDTFLDGQVRVTSPTGSYRFNSPYTILTTEGGLNGTTFSSLITPAGTSGVLSYTADDVLLKLTSQLGQLTGLNTNQRAVANVLDPIFNGGGSIGGLGAIFNGNVAANLSQASGEAATGSQQATFDAMSQFMGILTDPFLGSRSAGAGLSGGATTFVDENDASAYAGRQSRGHEAYAAINKAMPRATFEQRWSLWGAGYGGTQTTDGNAAVGSNTVTSRIFGFAAGADYRISPDTLAGFALAGGGTNFSLANGMGSGHSDLVQAGAFVRHDIGAAYLTAALAYGWQDVTTDRTVTAAGLDQLRANFGASAVSGRAEGGYRFVPGAGTGVTPYVAGQFVSYVLPGYAEQAVTGTNAFALSYAAKDVTASRSELGLRADKSWILADSILTLRGRGAWAHNFNTDRAIGATFQTLPGASFVVNGAAQASDAALVTGAVEMKWLNGFSLAGTFEGEFSNVTSSYAGKGALRYQW